MLVADVALDPRANGPEARFTYLASADLAPGDAVLVPLSGETQLGFVTDVRETEGDDLGFPKDLLRPVTARVEGLDLPFPVLALCRVVAETYLCSLPAALAPAIPPGARERLVTEWRWTGPPEIPVELSAAAREVARVVREADPYRERRGARADAGTKRHLRALRAKGLLASRLVLDAPADRRAAEPVYRLTADAARLTAFLEKERKKKPAQVLTLLRMQDVERPTLAASEIRALAGVTDATLRALRDAGLLQVVDPDGPALVPPPEPNPAQALAIEVLSEAVNAREARPFLLFGVTGSGKTEVYLRAAAEALRAGRSVLFLVPEIALATQAIGRLRERFGAGVAVLHSDLAPGERLAQWIRVRRGEASVVVGARSALFAPVRDLGLIVLDEEHEGSYKQETAPRYHARAMARALARIHGCPVVLGSATPSVETLWEAEASEEGDGEMTLLTLPDRAADARLPEVHVENLAEGYRSGRPGLFAPALHDAIEATLERGEQTILFLNRRAYAPFVLCRDCGHRTMCPHCSVSLSFHRRARRLKCHQCGHEEDPPEECPACRSLRIAPFGVGTEKVEEATALAFPTARVARLDRDVASRKGALEDVLSRFRTGELDILVGTQMVAKGLDFPNVTLVGVVAADVSLNLPDFRASERTFQLLSQVSGRAGRGLREGRVILQTFAPEHPSVLFAQAHDARAFHEHVLAERRAALYPPFVRLVNVVLTGEDRARVVEASTTAARRLEGVAEVLGPADCVLERIQDLWRRHLLLKLPPGASPVPVGSALAGWSPEGVRVTLDVDPGTLM